MDAMFGNGGLARHTTQSPLESARGILQAFIGRLGAERRRAANRRVLREYPDHLLKDMGIARSEFGPPERSEIPDILRNPGGWR
jgi:uncharacterized protein YjiS (DUF1127 family)